MNEMVERVARAIGVPEHSGLVCDWSLKAARAAIEAMREPTKEMIDEGHRHDPLACDVSEDQVEYCYGTMWRAMIDEALSDTSK